MNKTTKLLLTTSNCCWAAFFALVVTRFFLDFSRIWDWSLLGVALVLRCVAEFLPEYGDESSSDAESSPDTRPSADEERTPV